MPLGTGNLSTWTPSTPKFASVSSDRYIGSIVYVIFKNHIYQKKISVEACLHNILIYYGKHVAYA
jgi:hypothetical protein